MSRQNLPPIMDGLTHDQGIKRCIVMTDIAIHTMVMPNGSAYAAMVFNQQQSPAGAIVILERAEAEAQIALLRNALDDADRINAGKSPIHAPPTSTRQ